MQIPDGLSFFIALIIIMIIARKELSLGLIIGAILFALLSGISVIETGISIFFNWDMLLLSLIVLLIPLLGGLLEKTFFMKRMLQNFNFSPKMALMATPALFGLLPVAGGALMSAPIVDQIDENKEISSGKKVAINVWFRHTIILIYPLSSELLIVSEITGINIYLQVVLLFVPFFIFTIVGYYFLIRDVHIFQSDNQRNLKSALKYLLLIIFAPIFDLFCRLLFPDFKFVHLFMLTGLGMNILFALFVTKSKPTALIEIAKNMKIWRFPIMIIGIFWFLVVFEQSSIPIYLTSLRLPMFVLLLIGFLLGFTTGRIALPCTIIFPVFLAQNGLIAFPLLDFPIFYCFIFLGYLFTPIHPCVAYSSEYFSVSIKKAVYFFLKPIFTSLGIITLIYCLVWILQKCF